MSEHPFPWEEDEGLPFSEGTPPEDMKPLELVEYVKRYNLREESPLIRNERGGISAGVLTEEEEIFLTCAILCADRLIILSVDFFLPKSEVLALDLKERIDILTQECPGSELDTDVSTWKCARDEYESSVCILVNMFNVFEDLLIDSLDGRLGCFGQRYDIFYPFNIVVSEGEERLSYYTFERIVSTWNSIMFDTRDSEGIE
jgi:hypothetical protein